MRVLILRPKELMDETLKKFKNAGFDAYGCPFIELEYLNFNVPDHDVAIVMSQNSAREIVKRGIKLKRVIAIGKKTAEILKSNGYDVITPSRFDSATLVKEFMNELRGKKVVVVKSNARNNEIEKLSEVSDVLEVIAYRIKPLKGKKQREIAKNLDEFDVIVFSSSIIAKTFLELCDLNKLKNKTCIAIGPPTAKVLQSYGIKPLIPKEFTFDGVLELLKTIDSYRRKR